jgi:sec-independent protein translocase protein TatA
MFQGIGMPEIIIVAGIIVLLFGAKKLPEFARSMGKAKNEFQQGLKEGEAEAVAEEKEAEKVKAETAE